MVAALYPKARWKLDGKSGGRYIGTPWRMLLHTTETRGMPGYNKGYYAPHITYYPRYRTFTQHTRFTTAARALRNLSGGVQTNRNNTIQMEIIAYSAHWLVSGSGIAVRDLSNEQLQDIRDFLLWMKEEGGYDFQMEWPGRSAGNSREANRSGFRFSNAVWDEYNGVCGHQHCPENTHWDPDTIDWDAIVDGVMDPDGSDTENEEEMRKGDKGTAVGIFQRALMKWNPDALPVYGDDEDFGSETETWVKNFQRAMDLPDTGIIYGTTAALLSTYLGDGDSDHTHPHSHSASIVLE